MTLHADRLAWPHNYVSVARLEAFELLIAAKEGFLNDLFGVGLVAGDAEGDSEDGLAVAYDELAVGLFVS